VNPLKNDPVTEIVIISPMWPVFGRAVGEINVTVNATFVSRLMMDERDIETNIAVPAKMAGKVTPASVSTAAPLKSKVDMTMSDFVAKIWWIGEGDGATG